MPAAASVIFRVMRGRHNIATDSRALMDGFGVIEGDIRRSRESLQHRALRTVPERGIHSRVARDPGRDDPAERRPAGNALGRMAAHPGPGPRHRTAVRHGKRPMRNDGQATRLPPRLRFGPALPGACQRFRRIAGGRGQPTQATVARVSGRSPADGVRRVVGARLYRSRRTYRVAHDRHRAGQFADGGDSQRGQAHARRTGGSTEQPRIAGGTGKPPFTDEARGAGTLTGGSLNKPGTLRRSVGEKPGVSISI